MSKKGIDTRQHIKAKELIYIVAILQDFHHKIESDWNSKYIQFGNSLKECMEKQRFNGFLGVLGAEISKHLQKANPPTKTTLQRIFKTEIKSMNKNTKETLVFYLRQQNWDTFVAEYDQNTSKIQKNSTLSTSQNESFTPTLLFPTNDQNKYLNLIKQYFQENNPTLLPEKMNEHFAVQMVLFNHFFIVKDEEETQTGYTDYEEVENKDQTKTKKKQKKAKKWLVFATIIAILGFALIGIKPMILSGSLELERQASGKMPFKALFKYQANFTSIFHTWIEYMNMRRYSDTLYQNIGAKEKVYYNAGNYMAKLKNRFGTIDSVEVYIPTKSWYLLVGRFNRAYDEPPIFSDSTNLFIQNGKMFLPSYIKLSVKDLSFSLIKPFGISADSFCIEVTAKQESVEKESWAFHLLCFGKKQQAEVHYLREDINSKYSNKNLEFTYLRTSSDTLRYKKSPLIIDLTQWRKIRLETQNHILRTYLDNRLVAELPYKNNLDELVGLQIHFEGIGMVNQVKIWDKNQDLVYQDNFNGTTK